MPPDPVTNVFILENGLGAANRGDTPSALALHIAGQRTIWREYAPPNPACRAVLTPASASDFVA
jgi:hypothetical protein